MERKHPTSYNQLTNGEQVVEYKREPLTIQMIIDCIQKLRELDEQRIKNDPYFGKYPLPLDNYEGFFTDEEFKSLCKCDNVYFTGGTEGYLKMKARCERLNIKM